MDSRPVSSCRMTWSYLTKSLDIFAEKLKNGEDKKGNKGRLVFITTPGRKKM